MIFRNVSFPEKSTTHFWVSPFFRGKVKSSFGRIKKTYIFTCAKVSLSNSFFCKKNIPFSHNNSPSPHLLVSLPGQGSTARRGADFGVDLPGSTSPSACTTTGTTTPSISATSGTTSSQGLVPGQGSTALRGSQSRVRPRSLVRRQRLVELRSRTRRFS